MGDGFPYDRIVPHLFKRDRSRTGSRKSAGSSGTSTITNTEHDLERAVGLHLTGRHVGTGRDGGGDAPHQRKAKQPFEPRSSKLRGTVCRTYSTTWGHYVELACGDPKLVRGIHTQLDRAFPPESRAAVHTEFYSQYNNGSNPVHFYTGVSVSEPSTKYVAENRMTNWYRDTH